MVVGGCFAAGILVLRRRLCNHSDVTSLFVGPVVSVVWVPLVCGLSALFSPCCLLMSMLLLGFLACVCVSSVFLFFSLLCSCVSQALFGLIKIVFVIAFFLMKNVLRHGREKNQSIITFIILYQVFLRTFSYEYII